MPTLTDLLTAPAALASLLTVVLMLVLFAASGIERLPFLQRGRMVARLRGEIETLQDRLFQLADSDERHRSLIEAQGDYIVRRDGAGCISFANEAYAGLVGRPGADLAGETVLPKTLERTGPAMRADGACLYDERVATPAGERWIAWIETSLLSGSGRHERLHVGRDVTERVRAVREIEEAQTRAEAANAAKTRFLAMVSHEMRTPLSGIVGMASLLRAMRLDPEQRTYVDAVTSSAEALLSLIDGMLDISRIEAGRLDLARAPFDLHTLAEGVIELLAPKAQDKGIEIAVSIAGDVPRMVVGDVDRVRQIIVNLAGNAVKFTAQGGVGLSVARVARDRIALRIADTGPGIPADALQLIFEEFERADASPSGPEGAGLGLAISKGLITRMGGTISVTSEIGRGSQFEVVLPLPRAATPPEAAHRPDLTAARMLVVSSSPFEAPFLVERLGEAGASAERVADAAEAIRRLRGAQFDVVIVDRAMGEDETRQISAAARQAGAKRALVLLSPFERRAFGPPAEAGFDGYLVKPVRTRSLFARLAEEPPAGPATLGAARAAERLPRRVLIAEDSAVNALLARRMVEMMGGTAVHVDNGIAALEQLRAALAGEAAEFDCALIDIRMPGMGGIDVAKAVRRAQQGEKAAPLTLIAVTANIAAEDRAEALAAGFDAFLPKPLERDALAAVLRALPERQHTDAA